MIIIFRYVGQFYYPISPLYHNQPNNSSQIISERVTANMKVLIRENLQTKEINIYSTDGKLHTEEFFEKYFSDTGGAYPTLPYEREEFQTDAEWTIITEGDFRQLAETISVIQKAIDDVNELLIGGENVGEFIFQSECFLI